ncbi:MULTISPECIES: alpha/beta fold hydrolase [unclassified Streptomyces]|uniref:alpha/beta fold hydrolase n=1 Tax=unclassified Streptomyces TaxID=2593676 RepID=UPI0037103C39
MRPPRELTPPVVRPFRPAAPGGRTVYVVHPGALAAQVYRGLAEALPQDDGLTVLDLSGVPEYAGAALNGGRAETTVRALADGLAARLEPERGPYTLAGWSFGGVLALAMTRTLPADRLPRSLVLLDSIAPVDAYKQPDDALEPALLLGWFAMYLGAKRDRDVAVDASALAGRSTDEGLPLVLDAAVAAGALAADTPLPGLRKLYDTYVDGLLRNNRLTAPYRPEPAPLPVLLVKAERGLLPEDASLGWESLAPHGLTVRPCPGDHYTMLSRPDALAVLAPLLHAA